MRNRLSKNALVGYPAGVITGVAYGMNPLFAVPLMNAGAAVESILFFRYLIASALLGLFIMVRRQSIRINLKQGLVLFALGLCFTGSSIFLFEAYRFIATGLATTLVFLFPVLVAIIMVFLKVVPSWPVWTAIAATFGGVILMTYSDSGQSIDPVGVILSVLSALAYAFFIVIINRSTAIKSISNTVLTFYALLTGALIFLIINLISGNNMTEGIEGTSAWLNLTGLAVLPTIVSTATLAIATRNIGATKASVLEVFEPITAILIGTLVFGEPLTANIIAGISIAIVSVTFMIVKTSR